MVDDYSMPATFTITIDVSSIPKLLQFSEQLQPKATQVMQQAFSSALPEILDRERVKTGNMRRSTVLHNTSTGAEIAASAGYSGYQNFGTRYMSGTHFMEAGVSAITGELPSMLQSIFSI